MSRAAKRHQKKVARKAALKRRSPPPRPAKRPAGAAPADYLSGLTQQGLQHHRAGRLQEAEAVYRQVLEAKPGHPDANHLLGCLVHDARNHELAVELISKAVSKAPKQPIYRNSLGNAQHALGRVDDAVASYRKAIAIEPGYTEAYNNLGNALMSRGDLDAAVAEYQRALAIDPDYPEAHYNLANAQRELGRTTDAIASYRAALAVNPDYADARGNLANLLKDVGQPDDAVLEYRSALVANPSAAGIHNNLGNALEEMEQHEDAVACYRTAIRINADFPEAHNNLGNILNAIGQTVEAISSYRTALAVRPGYAEAHYNLGATLKTLGQIEEAISSYENAIAVKPDYTEARNNLGNALRDVGRLEEAVGWYETALGVDPDYAEAHSNLGAVLQLLGRTGEAFAHCRRAVALKPEIDAFWSALVASLETAAFDSTDDALFDDLLRLVERATVQTNSIAVPIISALRQHPDFAALLEVAGNGKPLDEIEFDDLARRVCAFPLFLRLIEQSHINDLNVERLLTLFRRAMLRAAMAEDEGDDTALACSTALALHCFTNEYVFHETEQERAAVEALEQRIGALAEVKAVVPALHLAALASYRPLHRFAWSAGLLKLEWTEGLQPLIARQIAEPVEERSLRDQIASLTPIDGSVTQSVREQYEENPYPRWVKADMERQPRNIAAVLRGSPLHFDIDYGEPIESPEILVAGCGTGQHALQPASKYRDARVLAIDLSLASLSYASRKSRELGASNIEYAQADIVKLREIGRTFDVIECSGVLHHMEDPMVGWRVLTDLLKPGGFMKIGLYSEIAREPVVRARALIAERGYTSSAEDIRRCRDDIISMAEDEASGMADLLEFRDFYALSECRDLIFHVQEHRFTLPQIEAALATLKLDFLGFEMRDQGIMRAFKEEHPDADAARSLEMWHEFEQANPKTFRGMYQFWCQKPASA